MGEKEKEFRKRIVEQNTTKFDGLLGRYTEEEQEFIAKVKEKRHLQNKEKNPELKKVFDFLPTEEEMDNYINHSLKAIFGEEVR